MNQDWPRSLLSNLTSSRFHQETKDPTLWPQEVALCTLEELSISQATTISLKTSHSKTSTCKKDTEKTDKLTDSWKGRFEICSCVLGANRTERARRAYIINCRPKVKFRKGSILQQLLRVSLRSNFPQAMVDLERAKKFDHGLAGVDDILPEHEKWYIELYLTLKKPEQNWPI